MYCSKCGKEIDYDALVCRECEQAEQTALVETPASGGKPRMRGFGKALTAAIVGVIGYLLAFYSFACVCVAGESSDEYLAIVALVLAVLSIGMAIISFVFGLKSIRLFGAVSAGTPRPIGTLVLGIVGIFCAAISLLLLFVVGFILYMMLVAS